MDADVTNPLACTASTRSARLDAHMNIETIVYVDLFMTPTAMALADVFLPACTYAERNGCAWATARSAPKPSTRP